MPGVIKCKCPHLAYHAYSQQALEASYFVSVTGGRATVPLHLPQVPTDPQSPCLPVCCKSELRPSRGPIRKQFMLDDQNEETSFNGSVSLEVSKAQEPQLLLLENTVMAFGLLTAVA